MKWFGKNTPEDGKSIEKYEITDYSYSYDNKEETKILFKDPAGNNISYWVASPSVGVDFGSCYACFGLRNVCNAFVSSAALFYSNNDSSNESNNFRPIVILKSGLQVDGGDGTSTNKWEIR